MGSFLNMLFRRGIAVFIAFSLFQPNISYAQDTEIRAVNYIKELSVAGGHFMTNTLAPTVVSAPLYSITRGTDGKFLIQQPQDDQREDFYTDLVLALLTHSVDHDIVAGPFEAFMRQGIGGAEFENCRVGRPQKTSDGFRALYMYDKGAEVPRIWLLRFSEFKGDPGTVDKKSGALIELLDGTRVLVRADNLDEAPDKYSPRDRDAMVMKYEVSELVASRGKPETALKVLFTGAGFQDVHIDVFADICNRLIAAYAGNKGDKDSTRAFLSKVRNYAAELCENTEISQAVQLMAGQTLTVLSWIDRGVPGAEGLRLTVSDDNMAANEKRGKSFLDNTALPEGIPEVNEEGASGFYWRGTERIKKLGGNVDPRLIFDKDRFEAAKDSVVMYLMDHGFLRVPEAMRKDTESGDLSTIHETYFVNDTLPGSFQTTSTGAGHFQGSKVDIKHVTEGRGIQVNVRYNANGEIEEVLAYEVKAGEWTLALPGYVDYMINLGGLRFNDISAYLHPDLAGKFSPYFDFSPDNLKAVAEAVKEKGAIAPYLAAGIGGKTFLIRNMENAPDAKWIKMPEGYSTAVSLTGMYENLIPEALEESLEEIAYSHSVQVSKCAKPAIPMLTEEALSSAEVDPAPSIGRTDLAIDLLENKADLIAAMLGKDADRDMLIRMPVQALRALETAGGENLKAFLAEIQDNGRATVELFSAGEPGDVSEAEYVKYIGSKKERPKDFTPSRENTVTLFTALKGEELTSRGRGDEGWGIGGIRPVETILSPVGLNYDKAGILRALVFGLELTVIARQVKQNGKADDIYVSTVLSGYRDFCFSQGVRNFDVRVKDLLDMAAGNINVMVAALNRIIKSIPIRPLNTEEIRMIYEGVLDVWMSA